MQIKVTYLNTKIKYTIYKNTKIKYKYTNKIQKYKDYKKWFSEII